MKLRHHEALNGELTDDALLDTTLGRHPVNKEQHSELFLALEVGDIAVGSDGQAFIGGANLYLTEAEHILITTHGTAELEGQRELTEHGGKGTRDILEINGASDGACAETEGDAIALTGQLHSGMGDVQLGVLLLYLHIV